MPLSLEACLPSHQAKSLHLNAALCAQPSAHLPTCTIDELLNLQARAPRGQHVHVCLSVLFTLFPGTEPGAQRVLSEGSADPELAEDPLWADSTVILLPPQPLPLVMISTRWWHAPGSGVIKGSSSLTMSYSVTLGHLLSSCRTQQWRGKGVGRILSPKGEPGVCVCV